MPGLGETDVGPSTPRPIFGGPQKWRGDSKETHLLKRLQAKPSRAEPGAPWRRLTLVGSDPSLGGPSPPRSKPPPRAGGRRLPALNSVGALSAGPCGRAGHPVAAPRCGPASQPRAQTGGRGRPGSGRAGREQSKTWLESGSLRGLGVPPRVAGGGPAARALPPSLEWRCSRRLAECAPRRQGGWERSGDGSGREGTAARGRAGWGWAGRRLAGEGRARGGRGELPPSPGEARGPGRADWSARC